MASVNWDLHFNLVCRLSRKLISAASISLLFICTDCQRDFMRTSNLSFEASHRKSSTVFDISFCALIPILGSGFIVWTITSLFLSGRFFPMEYSSPYFLLKTQLFYGLTLNGTNKKLNQPKMVVRNWMRSHRVVRPVSDRASACRHTYFASSANESLWALTLECPKHIDTCAAILTWLAFAARAFVNVWKTTQ